MNDKVDYQRLQASSERLAANAQRRTPEQAGRELTVRQLHDLAPEALAMMSGHPQGSDASFKWREDALEVAGDIAARRRDAAFDHLAGRLKERTFKCDGRDLKLAEMVKETVELIEQPTLLTAAEAAKIVQRDLELLDVGERTTFQIPDLHVADNGGRRELWIERAS